MYKRITYVRMYRYMNIKQKKQANFDKRKISNIYVYLLTKCFDYSMHYFVFYAMAFVLFLVLRTYTI